MPTTRTRTTPAKRPTRGREVCRWIRANCVHAEGDWYGQPFVLRRWQRAFLWRLYERLEDGSPAYRQALLGLPRGNGKTELAAAVAAYELFGTDRTDPVVVVAAASWDQADLVFGALKTMCRESPSLRDRAEVFESEILRLDAPGRAYRVAAVAGTNEGQRPTCVVADELHEWLGQRERVWTVLTSGAAKRADSLVLAITTAGWDRDSVCYRLYEQGQRIRRGELDEQGFYFEWHEAAPDAPVDDPATWASCNPALGDFLAPESLAQQVRSIPEHEYRRYHLNQWVTTPVEWIGRDAWSALVEAREVPEGEAIVLAFYGSYDRGQTALVGCTLGERPHIFEVASWQRPEHADKEWRTSVREVLDAVAEAMERYRVVEFAPCPPGWRQELEEWEQTYGRSVVRYEIARTAMWGPACDAFEQAVREGTLSHDGSTRIAAAMADCSPVMRSGYQVLAAPVPAAAAAAVIAHTRATWHSKKAVPMTDIAWI